MLSDLNSKFDEGMAELASVPAKIATSKKYLMQLNSIFGRWIRYSPAYHRSSFPLDLIPLFPYYPIERD